MSLIRAWLVLLLLWLGLERSTLPRANWRVGRAHGERTGGEEAAPVRVEGRVK